MRMKVFAPYAIHQLSFASVLEGEAGQAKLSRSGVSVARLQGVGDGHFIQAYFSTPEAEARFSHFVSQLDTAFLQANLPSLSRGHSIPDDLDARIRFVLEAMVEHTIFDMQLLGRCRHNTLYRLNQDPPHTYRALKVPFSPKVKAALRRDHGDSLDQILNEAIA